MYLAPFLSCHTSASVNQGIVSCCQKAPFDLLGVCPVRIKANRRMLPEVQCSGMDGAHGSPEGFMPRWCVARPETAFTMDERRLSANSSTNSCWSLTNSSIAAVSLSRKLAMDRRSSAGGTGMRFWARTSADRPGWAADWEYWPKFMKLRSGPNHPAGAGSSSCVTMACSVAKKSPEVRMTFPQSAPCRPIRIRSPSPFFFREYPR